MEFEDVLREVGDNGKYQRNLILYFLLPACLLMPCYAIATIFMVSVPDHWCYVPVVALSNLSIEMQKSLVQPPGNPKCTMYNVSYADLLSSGMEAVPNDSSIIPCTQGWQYDTKDYDYTASTQFNLVCDDLHFISFIFAMNNVGIIIATPIYGALSDKLGRKPVFYFVLAIAIISSVVMVFMPNFASFVVLKAIHASVMPCIYQIPFILVLELVGPHIRVRMNGFTNISWVLGMSLIPLLAYLTRNWATLILVTGGMSALFIFQWWLIPESPRWLVSQNRYREAVEIMTKIGSVNGKPPDKPALLQKLKKIGDKVLKEKEVQGVKKYFKILVKYPRLRKNFIIITVAWIATTVTYYGLQFNVHNLAGNQFLNFFLLTIAQLPGFLVSWYVMDRFGRRWCAVGGFTLAGIVMLIACIESGEIAIVCSIIGKFLGSLTFMTVYQQGLELYPTVIRAMSMGMTCTIVMAATFAFHYIIYLTIYGKWILFLFVGVINLIAGFAVSFLPETLNENLPQTCSDAEEFGRKQKYFSWTRRSRPSYQAPAESLTTSLKTFEDPCEENYSNDQLSHSRKESVLKVQEKFHDKDDI